jgi:acetylornithine deacetylase/succinyl-diaminopimelate desuccinylase-like protein
MDHRKREQAMRLNRQFTLGVVTTLALALSAIGSTAAAQGNPGREQVVAAIKADREAAVERLREWIALPTIANMGLNTPRGAEYMRQLALDAGFDQARIVETGGVPGVFATLDAGAKDTLAVYFMYDVKHFDPAEWSSPPLEGKIVDRPGEGKALVGRGASNQKGPEMAFLTALAGFRKAGVKLPVNLVLVAEGEEEIGSTHFEAMRDDPEVKAALQRAVGVVMPSAGQSRDGSVSIDRVDSPAWHLVKALDTLVSDDGFTPAIDGWFENVRALTPRQKELIAADLSRDEESVKKLYGVRRWINDESFLDSAYRLTSQPTVNIQGLVSGYTGPGGKTVLPGRAEAKLDLRLVPDMTREEAVEKLKAHLARRGFGDIEVIVSGGYSPTESPEDSVIVQAVAATLEKAGIEHSLFPRRAGSWPGVVFTGPPLKMAAGHFGIGRGGGAHAPDEWLLIDSTDPKVAGFEQQAVTYADYLYEVARAAKARR